LNDPSAAIVFGTIITVLFWTVLVAFVAYRCGVDHEKAASKDRNDESIVRTLTDTLTRVVGASPRPQREGPKQAAPRTHIPDPTMPLGSDDSNADPAGLGLFSRRNGRAEPQSFESFIATD